MASLRFGLTSSPTPDREPSEGSRTLPRRTSRGKPRSVHALSALFAVVVAGGGIAAVVSLPSRLAPAAESPAQPTAIVVAGQPFDVGRPVVLWKDPQGFDAYQTRCIDQRGG